MSPRSSQTDPWSLRTARRTFRLSGKPCHGASLEEALALAWGIRTDFPVPQQSVHLRAPKGGAIQVPKARTAGGGEKRCCISKAGT